MVKSGTGDFHIPVYKKLTSKFAAMVLVLFLAPQVLLYFYSSNQASEMLIESLSDDLKEKAFLVGADIDRYFDQRQYDVLALSQADILETDNISAMNQYLAEIVEATPYLDDVHVLDTDGLILAGSSEGHEAGERMLLLFPTLRHLFVDVVTAQQGQVYVSEVLNFENGPGLAFLTPITDDTNSVVIKVLLVEVNLETVTKIVAEFDDRVIGDKFVYLVDNDGNVIVTADPDASLSTPFPDLITQPRLLYNFSQQGDVGSIIYSDHEGDPVMAGFADMAEFGVNKAMDWSIVAVAPIADITKPVAEFRAGLLTISGIVFLIVAMVMFLTSRSIVGAVTKLLEGAKRVGAGEIEYRIEHLTNDEFGYLGKTVNNTLDNLVRSQQEAEKSNLSKSNFLAAMSHEIRTPMAGVIGMADLILDSDLSTQQLDWATNIKSSGENLLKILNEILDQSKLDAGKLEISPVDFHLASFVRDTTYMFGPKIEEKGLALNVELEDTLPEGLHADNMRIGQILSNLLSNALKFTEAGRITVRVGQEPRDGGDLMLKVTVLDSGIGLSDEAKEKLFTAFTQADNTTSRNYGGTGLGLSISKQLVELMGGEIAVESTEGVGSAFWFTVLCRPAKGEISTPDRTRSAERWIASRPLKVLVAEDNVTNQLIISSIFGKLGHEIAVADDGLQAVSLVEGNDYDVVLMDIRMPVMDGLTATRRIRAMDGEKSKLPIIALTADIAAGNIMEYTTAGMNAVCAKPIDLPVLLPAIDKCLGEEIHNAQSTMPPEGTPRRRATDIQDTDHSDGNGDEAAQSEQITPRILVAEDHHVDETIVSAMLASLGCQVDIVPDGREVIAAVLRSPYDLVLMDIHMPRMSGQEATRQIRALTGPKAGIPIIAVTADATPEQLKQWRAAGMNGHLTKPIDRLALEQIIAHYTTPPGSAPTPDNFDADTGTTSIPVLHDDTLTGLAELVGWETIVPMSEALETDFRARSEVMSRVAESGDIAVLGEQAHALKSVMGQFGARQAQETAAEIDALCKAGDGDSACKLVPALLQQGDAALIEVRRVVEKNTTTVLRQKA